jgi:tRNA-uridine 2-sulfurtransferase
MIRLTDGQVTMVRSVMALEGEAHARRIVVAMSGGVDSTVAAALLKGAGYDVVGITLQLYDAGRAAGRKGACCAGQDIHDARRAAASLGIPHYVLDFESRFRDTVIADFADSYLRGETPVPCVTCNRTVKFADLLGRAQALSAAALVTGHYAASDARGNSNRRRLLTPCDMARDQTYFLHATTGRQLRELRFPLGGMTKGEIRRLAQSFGLTAADKPDSQDICFVPDGRYRDVLLKLRPDMAAPGDIVDLEGRVIGRHDGVANFTVGQRRGLRLGGAEPLYVISLDARRRRVVAGPRRALRRRRIWLKDVNWLGPDELPLAPSGFMAHVRVRSTRPPAPARIVREGEAWCVEIEGGEEAVSPGQACVLYERAGPGAEVFGGGRIVGSVAFAPAQVGLPEAELEEVLAR